jgi:hypothetical protein
MEKVTQLESKREEREMLEYFDKEIKEVRSELMEQWARLEVLELFKSSLGEK